MLGGSRSALLSYALVLLASACAGAREAPPKTAARPLSRPAPIANPSAPPPEGIHVARRCYCLSRRGAQAEFAMKISADEATQRGVSIRVYPGASRDAILVKAPVVLHPKYEYVKFSIPALPGVEDFQLELNAKVRERAIGQIVTERCEQSCSL